MAIPLSSPKDKGQTFNVPITILNLEQNNSSHMNRKLRMGMVGGGKDAFIGAVHRIAAHMDGLIEVSCGELSIHEDVAKQSGEMLFLRPERTYLNYQDMLEKESKMPADKRIDFVTIVTPNF